MWSCRTSLESTGLIFPMPSGSRRNICARADLEEFVKTYHLDLSQDGEFHPRDAFGSHDDADHVYNTPRAWFMERYLNPHTKVWDGPHADFTPVSESFRGAWYRRKR